MAMADIRLKDVPEDEILRVPENPQDLIYVGSVLETVRAGSIEEAEAAADKMPDKEMMRRIQNTAINLGIEGLRRMFAPNYRKLAKHGEKPIRNIDVDLEVPDMRMVMAGLGMKIRRKTGMEMSPEMVAKALREVLSERKGDVERPEE